MFNFLTTEDGLSQSNVLEIYQDSKGFMWFGTYDGLNRYDGYNFKVYKYSHSDPNSISSNVVISMHEDKHGTMWFGTFDGLNRYNAEQDNFTSFRNDSENDYSLSNNVVWAIYSDSFNNLWVGTENGLNKFDYSGESFTTYFYDDEDSTALNDNFVKDIYEDSKKNLWIATGGYGLGKYNHEKDNFKRFIHDPKNKNSLPHDDLTTICEDKNGNLWIGTLRGLSVFNPAKNTFKNYYAGLSSKSLSSNQIVDIVRDKNDKIWIATSDKGVNLYDDSGDSFFRYRNEPVDKYSLSDNVTYSLFEDNSGILWIGGRKGINKYVPEKQYFGTLKKDFHAATSLSDNGVTGITRSGDGNYWIGTWDGLNRYNRDKNEFKNFFAGDYDGFDNSLVYSVYCDSKDRVWVGCQEGVSYYDQGTGRFRKVKIKQVSAELVFSDDVYVIAEDKNGTIWIGTDGGVYSLDEANNIFVRHNIDKDLPEGIGSLLIWEIHGDQNGIIWIGTDGKGLFKYNPVNKSVQQFLPDYSGKNSIGDNRVFDIYENSEHNLWIGTGGGLCFYDQKSKSFTLYNEEDGLLNNTIVSILEDDESNLWLGTNNGIEKFNSLDKTFHNYGLGSGLQGFEFNIRAAYKAGNGDLLFGGTKGISVFSPWNIKENPYPPKVSLIEVKMFNDIVEIGKSYHGQIVLTESAVTADTLFFSYLDKVITLEFAALHFSDPELNRYRYKLKGFESNWNNVGHRRFASYTNLPPGEYFFTVQAASSNGNWNEGGRSITLTIVPPVWARTWFKVLASFLVIVSLFVVYKLRIRRIELRSKALEIEVKKRTYDLEQSKVELEILNDNLIESERQLLESNKSKDKFFSILSHDLKNPFSSLLGFAEVLQTSYDELSEAEKKDVIKSIGETSRSSYQLLEHLLMWSMSQTGKIERKPESFNLFDSIYESISHLMPLAQKKKIKLFTDADKAITVYADRNMILTVLRNLITNAIKFSHEDSEVKVTANVNEGECIVSVVDSGVGMDDSTKYNLFRIDKRQSAVGTKKEKGTGLGLILCKEFIELNRGHIIIESELGQGSKFIFTLPLES